MFIKNIIPAAVARYRSDPAKVFVFLIGISGYLVSAAVVEMIGDNRSFIKTVVRKTKPLITTNQLPGGKAGILDDVNLIIIFVADGFHGAIEQVSIFTFSV